MLTFARQDLLLHVPRNMLQKGSLHNFPKDWNKAHHPGLLWIILLTCFEDECDISFSLGVRSILQSQWHFKDDREQLWKDISNCLHVWMQTCFHGLDHWYASHSMLAALLLLEPCHEEQKPGRHCWWRPRQRRYWVYLIGSHFHWNQSASAELGPNFHCWFFYC